jgi:hypothetical protein
LYFAFLQTTVNKGWYALPDDAKLAVQIDRYPNWQNVAQMGYPKRDDGQTVTPIPISGLPGQPRVQERSLHTHKVLVCYLPPYKASQRTSKNASWFEYPWDCHPQWLGGVGLSFWYSNFGPDFFCFIANIH